MANKKSARQPLKASGTKRSADREKTRKRNAPRKQDTTAAGKQDSSAERPQAKIELGVDPNRHDCVVVGIGASAGGIEAFKRLLRHMPDDSGMAFVLVQHLDPTHESLMVELLSKYTSMPVLQVKDAMPIQPNHVYMIPPNRFLKIQGGGLFLDGPIVQRSVRLPIDYFFRSLAEARRERSICVVLSGAGSDGADGVREVKAEGGITIVQQPETAEYDGMPRAAISTGAVDFVLPIEGMAEVIVPYARHPYVQGKPNVTLADTAPDQFRAIISLMRARTDQDFSRYKKGTLTRRIGRRMGIRQISNPADYLKLLREDRDELRNLFKDFLIGVTRFFRDPPAWDDLAEVLTRVIQERQEGPFRIWVPGCATGEEAYSLAMLLFEQRQRQNRHLDLQVFATDIDSDAIDAARLGIYPENVAKDLADARLDVFFQREGEGLRVRKKLRETCVFAVQNLLSDPPFSNLDLICCRNLLIYLESDVQRRIFDMLHFALKPAGLLFLGNSESPAKRKDLFEVVSQSSRIYRKVGESKPGSADFPVDSVKSRAVSASTREAELGTATTVGTVELSKRALLDQFAPASVVVNHRGLIQYIHGSVRNYLDFPSGEPDLDVAAMVQEGLKAKTRTALQQARTSNETVSIVAPRVRRDGGHVAVRLRIYPLPSAKGSEPLYLVSFFDEAPAQEPPGALLSDVRGGRKIVTAAGQEVEDTASDRQLALELQATREDLQCTIEEFESANEELKASNEEVMSMNEELQSTNEVLATSREELQSLNEELSTVNNQLHDKVEELEATTNDLTNLLTSTDIATLFLDNDLRIRRYTPAMSRLMSIIETDVGRPVSDLSPRVNDPHLVSDAQEVLQRLTPVEKEVQNSGYEWFLRRTMPFRTSDNKIEGVVVTFADVTKLKKASDRVELHKRQQAVIAQIGRAVLAGDDLQTLFDRAVHDIAKALDVDFCKVLRLEPNKRELRLLAGVGWKEGLVGQATVPAGTESQAGYTLQSAGPVIVEDLRKEKRFSGPALLTDHQVVSGISVIIGPEDSPWGVFGAHTRQRLEFTIDDTNFVLTVAHVLWEAIRRNAIETELRDNEARTAAFLNNSAVIGWMNDDQGRHVYLSQNYQRRFNVKLEDWRGKTDAEVWPAEFAEKFRANDQRVLEENEPIEVIEEAVNPDGTRAYFLSSKFPFTDSGGNRYVGGLAVDVTERIQTERALAESEERLRLAARMAGFGTYYGDVETGEVTWSPELKGIFGLRPDDPVPVGLGGVPDFVHEEDRKRVEQKIKASLDAAGDGEFQDEHRIVRPDGKVRWLLMQGRTAFKGKGTHRRPVRTAGVALDITERRKFEEALEEARHAAEAASEAKSTFLANMSHEIRTPMTAILGYADVLYSRLRDPDAQACVRTIKENGTYLCDILNDILDLSKIESGKLAVRRESCSIVEILADIRSLMAVRATEKNLTLSIEFEGEIPGRIVTDRKMVRQILVNLAGNAIKFTERGGVQIVAKCLAEQELLEIAVIDTGIGIDPDHLESLFLPFEQLDNSFTRTAGGSGLGLAICKKLVELLGGELTVASAVNEGSTFRFTIRTGPLQDAQWKYPNPSLLREGENDATPDELPKISGRILAVDDRPEIRYLVQEFVESAGGQVETAENGALSVQAWIASRDGKAPIDAVLMDVQMPVMDGLETTRKLRAEGYEGPVIALTANAMRSDRDRCLKAGCDDFVTKPIDRAELIHKLAKWTSKSAGATSEERRPGVAILCVDDNEATCYTQKILLERRGYRVETARTGDAALQALESFTPDVALLDLGLEGMSGSELLAQLKTRPALVNCLFVCLSGRGQDEVAWRDMGFDHFLQKPADLDELERVIRRKKPA